MLLKMVVIAILNLLLFYVFGIVFFYLFKIKENAKKNAILVGFFAYFGVFQFAAESMILTQSPFTYLVKLWLLILFFMLLFFVFIVLKHKEYIRESEKRRIFYKGNWLWYLMILVIVFQLLYMFLVSYNGWDTGFYVGTMNTTLQTNSMYIYSGTHGRKELYMNLRYALSSFYMQETIWCYLFDFHPMLYHKYVSPVILTVLSVLVYYILGKECLEKDNKNYLYLFLIFCVVLNFFNKSEYTTSGFLLERSGEAKAYLGSVIIPALYCIFVRLWKNAEQKSAWLYLFLVVLSSNTISMSSMLIVPVVSTIGCASIWVTNPKCYVIRRYLLCMIYPIFFLLIFYLYWKGIFVIKVK